MSHCMQWVTACNESLHARYFIQFIDESEWMSASNFVSYNSKTDINIYVYNIKYDFIGMYGIAFMLR